MTARPPRPRPRERLPRSTTRDSGSPAAAMPPPLPLLEERGRRAAGHRLADRGLRLVQPRARPVLDRRLHRCQGPAARSEQIQGKRPEIEDLRHRSTRAAGTRSSRRAEQDSGRRRVSGGVAVRAPQLQHALRSFVLGAFAFLLRELDDGAELPVAFVEHEHAGGPALYEYRPLVRASSRSGRRGSGAATTR